MNEATFNISIKDAALILKKMKFLKRRKEIGIGAYSSTSLDIAKLGDLKKIHQTAIDNNDYELLLDDDSIFNLVRREISSVMLLFNRNQLIFPLRISY